MGQHAQHEEHERARQDRHQGKELVLDIAEGQSPERRPPAAPRRRRTKERSVGFFTLFAAAEAPTRAAIVATT